MKPEVFSVEAVMGTFPHRFDVMLGAGVFTLRWSGTAVDYKDAIRQAGAEWEHRFSCSDADAMVPLTDEAG